MTQIRILDDNWEVCYGDAIFDTSEHKFPDPKGMIAKIKEELGYRVTIWVHPFVNLGAFPFVISLLYYHHVLNFDRM